jgi:predicted ATPase/class 3 adenylate cyclase/DNA-binding SARP family transcriptional activator
VSVLCVLGPLEVVRGGQPVRLGSRRQRLALAVLAVHANKVVSTDRLTEALWGDTPPPSAVHTLHTLVARLRAVVGSDRIETRPPGYRLRIEPEEFDALRFDALVHVGLTSTHRPDAALGAFDDALALWRGPAFAEFVDEEFAEAEAARLEELRIDAIEARAAALLEVDRAGEAVGELEAQITHHPLRERLRAVLMLALARAGRPVEALRAYEAFRRFLAEEIGVVPSPELQQLNDDIARQHPDLGWERSPSSGVAAADLPSGTVTFLFTDLEDSTRLWEEHPETMKDALARHDAILRDAVEGHGGHVVKTTGDGIHAAFATAEDAIEAAVAGQAALVAEAWGVTGPLHVRMGLHTGSGQFRDGDYYGPAVNRAARLTDVAHGGQVVVSLATEQLVGDALPLGVGLVDLGEHRLRDLSRPERVFGLIAPGLSSEFPPLRSLDLFLGNLPLQLTSFVGRDHELAAIDKLLREERLVTLTGVGGVGKTRLALQAAAEVLPWFPDGAWLCELAAASDGDSMEQLVAATLAVQPREGLSIGGAVREFLRTKTLLVVLDNCEHLLEPAGRLAEDLLHACPHLRILATSRERLAVEGEHVRIIRSLELPDASADPSTVVPTEAVRLFVERARSVSADFVLETATIPVVGELCRRLDGVPLAIELAAARVAAMSPAEIAERLDERFRLLTGGRRTAIHRHQTIRATVDWSYSLLSPAEQLVFARLGTFPGTFDTAAAQVVAASDEVEGWGVVDALSSLVDKSMVVADPVAVGTTRYSMLETLRAYARERIDESGDPDLWRRRHAQHYAAFAEQAGPGLHSAEELTWRPRLRVELDNLRAAVTWALDSPQPGDGEIALRIIAALAYELPMDAATHVGVWATRAVPRVDETTPGRRTAVLGAAAVQAVFLGDHETAATLAGDALRDGLPPDCPAPMTTYTALALVEAYSGRLAEAMRVLREPIAGLEASGDLFTLSSTHSTLSVLAWFAGELGTARAEAEEAVRLAHHIGSPHALAMALFALGQAMSRSDAPRALGIFEECVALVQGGAGGNIVIGGALAEVGRLRARAGDPIGAVQALRAAVQHQHDTGDRSSLAGHLLKAIAPLVQLHQPEPAAVLGSIVDKGSLAPFLLASEEERRERQEAMHATRAQLSSDAYDSALARGAAMTYDEVVTYTLGELDRLLAEARDT